MIGLRGRLYSKGSGKWEESGGETSKFGLTTVEMLECFRILRESGLESYLQMLHFHIGSQITDIRKIKTAVKEASRVYAKFRHMKVPVEYLNVGRRARHRLRRQQDAVGLERQLHDAGVRQRRRLHRLARSATTRTSPSPRSSRRAGAP